jgi:hypothetical protein
VSKLDDRLSIKNESKARMQTLNSGDQVTNICAGVMGRYLTFVEYKIKSRKNKFGITHREYLARCQFGNRKTGDFEIDVIHKGRLSKEECKELFEPVWQAQYGK